MDLNKIALETINKYKSDKIIMGFVTKNALEKVAEEMNEAGASCTAKAVDILRIRHEEISDRVEHYINAGLVGCYMASFCK